jgi:hypothetical protein
LATIAVPDEVSATHGLLASAVRLATLAVSERTAAIAAADLDVARNASSAAAGALMLAEQAREDLGRALRPPALP